MDKLRNFFRTKPTTETVEEHEDEFSVDGREEELSSVEDDASVSTDEPNAKADSEVAPPETETPETQEPKREKKKVRIRKCRPASCLRARIDGGWAWVVVLAGFFIVFVVDGICFSFGVLYTELLGRFQENRAETSLVGSLLTGLYICTAPLPSFLAKKFGYRPVAIIGCVIASVAFLIGSFSDSIGVLIICYGLCAGIGSSFLYLTAMATVSLYFDIDRPLAYGLASSGSGIGMLIIPLLVDDFRDLGWNGVLRLEAGLLLSCLLACLAFRALPREDPDPEMHRLVQQTRHLRDTEFLTEVKREFSIKDVNENELKNEGGEFGEDSWDKVSESGVFATINIGQQQGETGYTSRRYEKEASDIMPDNLINAAVYRAKGARFSIGTDTPTRPLQMVPDDIMEITPESKSVLCNDINKPRMKTVPENAIISTDPTFVPAVTAAENGKPAIRNYIPIKDSPLVSHRRWSSSSIHSVSDTSSSDLTTPVSYSQDYYVTQSHGYVVINFSTEYEQQHGLYGLQSEPPIDYVLLEEIHEKEMSLSDDASLEVSFPTEIVSDPIEEERFSESFDEQGGPAPRGRSGDEESTSSARLPADNGEQEAGDEIRVDNLPSVQNFSEDSSREEHESQLSDGEEGKLEAGDALANHDRNEEQPPGSQSEPVIVEVHTEGNPVDQQLSPAGAQDIPMETRSGRQETDRVEGDDCQPAPPQVSDPSIQVIDSNSDLEVRKEDHRSGPHSEPTGEASGSEQAGDASGNEQAGDASGSEPTGEGSGSESNDEASKEETTRISDEMNPKEDSQVTESRIKDLSQVNSDLDLEKEDHQSSSQNEPTGEASKEETTPSVNNESEPTEDIPVTESETAKESSLSTERGTIKPHSAKEPPASDGQENVSPANAAIGQETDVDKHVQDNQSDSNMQEVADKQSLGVITPPDAGDSEQINIKNGHEGLGDKVTIQVPSEQTPAVLTTNELSPKTSRRSSRSVSFATPVCTNSGVISLSAINAFYRRKSYTPYLMSSHDSTQPRKTRVLGALRNTFDFSVFRRKLFIFITVHSFLAPLGWYTVLLFLPDFAQGHDLGEGKASFLISVVGISTVVFRVLSGCLVYYFPDYVRPLFVWSIVSFLVACVTWALPDMTSYGEMTFAAIMCGMLLAADVALRTVTIEEALGTEHLTSGFTYNCLVSGVAIIMAGPLNDALYSIHDTYESPFHFAASAMFFAAVTNVTAIIVTRFWPDTKQPVRGLGLEAVWVHLSVLQTVQARQLTRRRKANVAELITWHDVHLREHSDAKEKLEQDHLATTSFITQGSDGGFQDSELASTSNNTHAPVIITVEHVDENS